VAEAAPNPGGSRSDPNRDFIALGVGNIASGLFRGQPVGGSVGQTALNVAAGGRTRWASIFSGIWMLLILVLFSGVVGEIPIPTLAAVLIWPARCASPGSTPSCAPGYSRKSRSPPPSWRRCSCR
jgi:sulfate permease, SulP family